MQGSDYDTFRFEDGVFLLGANTPPARLESGVFAHFKEHHLQAKTHGVQTHHVQALMVVCYPPTADIGTD